MSKSTLKDNRTLKSYSESFKQKVLNEISDGKYTKNEVIRRYNIGTGTLYNWIRNMSRLELYNQKIRVQMPQERDEIKQLKKQIKELEQALVQIQLKHLKAEADLEVALEQLGYDSKEAFEKKQEANRSKKR